MKARVSLKKEGTHIFPDALQIWHSHLVFFIIFKKPWEERSGMN